MLWITTNHRDESVHYQSNHQEDFKHGHVELRGTEPANGKTVEDA